MSPIYRNWTTEQERFFNGAYDDCQKFLTLFPLIVSGLKTQLFFNRFFKLFEKLVLFLPVRAEVFVKVGTEPVKKFQPQVSFYLLTGFVYS
ncbi:MAG: hypothetical protein HOG03_09490 [Desulfobacula sp.]|jgi:hypothetical protein|uniref:hypothetical protein n=1 Tax=Desulfobacula sp. TaxID=2593537 RepID=UPI001D3193C7|nr:hypothetical protein [Desulfobacula sp.]MBT3485476.1 hypothetical protein [Desulfobacula sp.]MBT3804822.1 hypothetical protein [Desulfobacula sp.]MBT4026183.1 hypothetical protein [Desulfobacula sp.]MBT4199748.1 hypothetical protein [Desulfobacula sp.]